MTEEQTPNPGADDELVTPEEHAEAFESIEPGQDVADDAVPDDVEIAARSADGADGVDDSTNYLPPEDVEQHDDNTGEKPTD